MDQVSTGRHGASAKLLRIAGIIAAIGTAPLVITIVLMQLRIVDSRANPVGLDMLMWLSWLAAGVIAGIGLVRRWLGSLNDF